MPCLQGSPPRCVTTRLALGHCVTDSHQGAFARHAARRNPTAVGVRAPASPPPPTPDRVETSPNSLGRNSVESGPLSLVSRWIRGCKPLATNASFVQNTVDTYSTLPYSLDFSSTHPVTRSEEAPPQRSQADHLRVQADRRRRGPSRRGTSAQVPVPDAAPHPRTHPRALSGPGHAARPRRRAETAPRRLRAGVPGLAARGVARPGFRVVHYSIQDDHAHFIVEAGGKVKLANGMKSLGARFARCVNRTFGRRGAVLKERFHHVVKRTPTEVRTGGGVRAAEHPQALPAANRRMAVRSSSLRELGGGTRRMAVRSSSLRELGGGTHRMAVRSSSLRELGGGTRRGRGGTLACDEKFSRSEKLPTRP